MEALWSLDPVLGHTAAAGIGSVLILAAIAKLRDIPLFRAAMDNYRLLPDALLGTASWFIPLLELLAGVLLLPSSTRSIGAVLALAALALVSGAVAIQLARNGERIDCGCGSDTSQVPISYALLVRNALLMALVLLAALPVTERPTVWIDAMTATLGTLFFLGLYQTVNLWLSHQPRLEEMKNAP
jgi:hypothetical protein